MTRHEYVPRPIDTSQVRLPREIDGLTEKLARNAHENWAQRRMADGWRWGEMRDDRRKLHPCLVSYDELPESEKQYDRVTALETVKVMLALGFRIRRQ